MQGYLRPIVDFLALKLGILIAKKLFNGIAYQLTMHVWLSRINRSKGQKVQLRIFFQKDTTDD